MIAGNNRLECNLQLLHIIEQDAVFGLFIKDFEESLVELESIVKELESGNVDLDQAINKYSDAMKLAKSCSDKLNNATLKVNQILKENGVLEDFEIEE